MPKIKRHVRRVPLRVEPELYNEIEALARKEMIDVAPCIRRLLVLALDRLGSQS